MTTSSPTSRARTTRTTSRLRSRSPLGTGRSQRGPRPTAGRTASTIQALAAHPATARRLARKLYAFFVSEVDEPSPATLDTLVDLYRQHDTAIRPLVRYLLESAEFSASTSVFARYAWPVEFVVRAIKEVGWIAYTANQAIPFLTAMGQLLFEPPNVGGWKTGTNWFSTSRMLARMNFAGSLCGHQHYPLVERFQGCRRRPRRAGHGNPRHTVASAAAGGRARRARRLRARGLGDAVARRRRGTPRQDSQPRAPHRRRAVPAGLGETAMKMSRRTFHPGRRTACSAGLVLPRLVAESVFAQSAAARTLVILNLSGGNDALSMLVPSRTRSTTAGGRRSPCPRAPCCRSAPTPAATCSGCIRR